MNIEIIRVSGETEKMEIWNKRQAFSIIGKHIGADTFDTVNLRDGRVMIVDDTGMIDGKPVNPEATKLYHAICIPGTVHCIHGDVAIAIDKDFA